MLESIKYNFLVSIKLHIYIWQLFFGNSNKVCKESNVSERYMKSDKEIISRLSFEGGLL